jgi:endoglucanase
MFKKILSTLAIGCAFGCSFWACDSGAGTMPTETSTVSKAIPVDYTLGRTMNAILGRGINLGNSWESEGPDDGAWSNPIRDTDFAVIKAAGFNSVRIPVRWQFGSDYSTHTVDPNRLNGVLNHIRLAIANGLAVVVNFHHYVELNCAGGGGNSNGTKCAYSPSKYETEKAHFLALWAQVATAMGEFRDDQVVLEILNEPIIPNVTLVDQLMNEAYTVIRKYAPGKTIMFETYHAAKFGEIATLHLPQDGNIIFSGHYYEPYTYSHQGHGYECKGDAAMASTADEDMEYYAGLAYKYYPDVNGVDQIPLNMGEFGIAGGDPSPCQWQQGEGPSTSNKAYWAAKAAKAAVKNGMSFHYWGFGQTGGFDAYNTGTEEWYPGFPGALIF